MLMSCQAKMTDVVGGRAGAGKRSPSSAADDCTADTRLEGHNRSGDHQTHWTNTNGTQSHRDWQQLFLAGVHHGPGLNTTKPGR